ncbi:MAG TPA: hypothetical protein VI258_08750, partial [Rhodanobacteraceae bacterium]
DSPSWYIVTSDEGEVAARVLDDPAGVQFDGTFVYGSGILQPGNYTSMVVSSTGFTLVANAAFGSQTQTPLNGIQIVRADRIFFSDFDR